MFCFDISDVPAHRTMAQCQIISEHNRGFYLHIFPQLRVESFCARLCLNMSSTSLCTERHVLLHSLCFYFVFAFTSVLWWNAVQSVLLLSWQTGHRAVQGGRGTFWAACPCMKLHAGPMSLSVSPAVTIYKAMTAVLRSVGC